MSDKVWYKISRETAPVPTWVSTLVLDPGGQSGELVGDWELIPRTGHVVRVLFKRGGLTFEAKQTYPVRSPKKAKALARRLVAETEQWLAQLV